MANLLKELLIDKNYSFVVLDNQSQLTPKGIDSIVYYFNDTNTAKKWNYQTQLWEIVTIQSVDLVKVANITNLPNVPPNKESLYFIQDNKTIYIWTEDDGGLNGRFVFAKTSVNMSTLVINDRYVKYVSEAVPPTGIKLNTIYYSGIDDYGHYIAEVANVNQKYRFSYDRFIIYFKDVSNVSWGEITGSYVPPSEKPKSTIEGLQNLTEFLAIYDGNKNGFLDTSENSLRLEGMSKAYFENYTNTKISEISMTKVKVGTDALQNVINIETGDGIKATVDMATNKVTFSQKAIISQLKEAKINKIENIENGTKIKISFTNAESIYGSTFANRQIAWTNDDTVNLSSMTREQCVAEPKVTMVGKAIGNGMGKDDEFILTPITLSKAYKFKIFTEWTIEGVSKFSSVGSNVLSIVSRDDTPLSDITELSVVRKNNNQVEIKWKNPNLSTDDNYQKTEIYRGVGQYPTGNDISERIYESTNKNAGNLNTFVDNVSPSIKYYYSFKILDVNGNANMNSKFTVLDDTLGDVTPTSLTSNTVITNLTNSINGNVIIDKIEGKTQYKKSDGTLTDTWESGVTLESVGENGASLYTDINTNSWVNNITTGTVVKANGIVTFTSGGSGFDGVNFNNASFKPNTTYTIIANVKENSLTQPFALVDNGDMGIIPYNANENSDIAIPTGTLGLYVTTFTTGSSITNNRVKAYCYNNEKVGSVIKLSSLCFYEGDVRAWVNPIDGKVNRVGLLSRGKNLFDGSMELGVLDVSGFPSPSSTSVRSVNFTYIYPNSNICISQDGILKNVNIFYYDKNYNYISNFTGNSFTTPSNCYYVKFYYSTGYESTLKIQLETGSNATAYTPYKQDKIEILSKLPLQSISSSVYDYVEKYGDIIRNCGRIVLNGSENWVIEHDLTNAISASTTITDMINNGLVIVDILQRNDISYVSGGTVNCYALGGKNIGISILKSQLSTQDITGFKKWLSQNPTTVIYQLANTITEVTNKSLTLECYENGTLTCNSALVNPNLTLSYTTNIGEKLTNVHQSISMNGRDISGLSKGMGVLNNNINTLSSDLSTFKTEMKDTTGTNFTTEKVLTKLDNCNGGFVSLEKIQGATYNNLSKFTVITKIPSQYYSINEKENLTLGRTLTLVNNTGKFIAIGIYENNTYKRSVACPSSSITFTTTNTETARAIVGYPVDGWTDANQNALLNVMILDGTVTQAPQYFEGMKSVGENSANIVPDFRTWTLSPVAGSVINSNNKITITTGLGGYDGLQLANTSFKSNTQYTVAIKIDENTLTQPYSLIDDVDMGISTVKTGVSVVNVPVGKTGVYCTTFTTGTIANNRIDSYVSDIETVGKKIVISNFSFFEGDMTGYVDAEGRVNKIEILTEGKNLFPSFSKTISPNLYLKNNNGDFTFVRTNNESGNITTDKIQLKPNTKYTFSMNFISAINNDLLIDCIIGNSINHVYISQTSSSKTIITDSTGILYLGFTTPNNTTPINVTFNVQLEEGDKSTSYEAYDENKTEILSTTPWRQWDTQNSNGIKTIGSREIVLNGSEVWQNNNTTTQDCILFYTKLNYTIAKEIGVVCPTKFRRVTTEVTGLENYEFIGSGTGGTIYLNILKSRLTVLNTDGLVQWLMQNPEPIIYKLATPYTENTNKTLNLTAYENGYLQVNSGEINPVVTGFYSANLGERIKSMEKALSGIYKVALAFADRELRMKSIDLLTTDTNAVLKNKMNEMLNAWKA